MAAAPRQTPHLKVSQVILRRLKELQRTPSDLARALQVPESYVSDLLAGRRLPPGPNRSDVYAPMSKFLRLHPNDLPASARAEHQTSGGVARRPPVKVRKLLLELCEPSRAAAVTRGLGYGKRSASLEILITQRLLDVAQGFVRRQLEDEVGIRVAAKREGCSHTEIRLRLINFLDVMPDSLTVADHETYLRPRIATWDIDLETHAMKIVLRSHDPEPRRARALRL
jgi:Fe-S cluster assembly iron-binding protein IscA